MVKLQLLTVLTYSLKNIFFHDLFLFLTAFGEQFLALIPVLCQTQICPQSKLTIPTESRQPKDQSEKPLVLSVAGKEIVLSPAQVNSSWHLHTGCSIMGLSKERSLISRIPGLSRWSQVFVGGKEVCCQCVYIFQLAKCCDSDVLIYQYFHLIHSKEPGGFLLSNSSVPIFRLPFY